MKGNVFGEHMRRLSTLLGLLLLLAADALPIAAQQPLLLDRDRPNIESLSQTLDAAAKSAPASAISSVSSQDDAGAAASVDAVLATATQVAAGMYHTCALTAAGEVKCWGDNSVGQLGDGTTTSRATPTDVSELGSGVMAVAAGMYHTCALIGGGGVKCWGNNDAGQLGDGTATSRYTPVAVSGLTSGMTAVAAGGMHTCALTGGGGAKCWGWNDYGQLGDGTVTGRLTPVAVSGLGSGVTAMVAGAIHTCALIGGGGVKCWGNNDAGQLGDGTATSRYTPVAVRGLTSGVLALAAGYGHTCALTGGGGVKCWGWNDYGQLGDGTATSRYTPVAVSGLASGMTAVTAGNGHTCALTGGGGVKCWGWNDYGQLGDGTTTSRATPVAVSGLTSGISVVTAGWYHTCALTRGGGVKCWGGNDYGQLGDGMTTRRSTPVAVRGLANDVTAVAAGAAHACALSGGGGVKCWGLNFWGQLGDGTTISRYTPAAVSGLGSAVTAVAAGDGHTCALTGEGGVKCWGGNDVGQLGDGTRAGRTTPVAVSGLGSGMAAVAAGGMHTCALTGGGGVKCWGWNSVGQLGDGTTTDRIAPVAVSGLGSGAMAVAAGWRHTCTLTGGGGVKCWGWNYSGQLGDGTTTNRTTPVVVSGLASGVTAVVAGMSHTCALTAAGAVKCWGNNDAGQLGDGTRTSRFTPAAVSGLGSGVVAVAAGGMHTCALTRGGGVKCWGGNDVGQLGDGTRTGRTTPVAVSGLGSGVTALAAGTAHTCAVIAEGGVMCWGNTSFGLLGVDPGWTPVDVVGFGPAPTYTISGRVTDASGAGIPGVIVWADTTRSITTDGNGNYTLTGLPAGTYSVRPSLAPYAFSPASRSVTVPPNATGLDFQAVAITKVHVNQALGNTTNYVAGKDTAVRVFMSGPVPYDPDHQQLKVYRDGSLITPTPLKPRAFSGRSNVLDFICDRAECGGWQKGFYSFEATINGDYLIQPSVKFQMGGDLRVLVVPVTTRTGTPRFDWPSIEQYMKNVYPLAANAVKWKPSKVELPADELDLLREADQKELLIRLEKWRRRLCRTRGATCYDAIVGIIPEMKICNPPGCIPCDQPGGTTDCHCTKGWTAENVHEIKSAVVMEVEEMPTVGVHEVGHLLGLGDEYKGGLFKCDINPPPSSYVGRGGLQCTTPNIPEWTGACGASGSKVRGTDADLDDPFEVVGRGALPDMLSFMGSGEKQAKFWVTPTAYNHLFSRLSLAATYAVTAPQITERVVDVSGWILLEDTVSLDPVYHAEADTPPVVVGPYSIEVLDAQGSILADQGFNVSFAVLTEPPQDADEGPFVATVRFPTGAVKLRVKHGTIVLTEALVSTHVPNVTLISPTGGQTWAATGNYTIRWQGSDLDGDILHYTVLYRQGTGDWSVLGADLTTTELTVDAAYLPGGTAAQVQVLATDGINTTAVESGLFTVGRKPPEVFITYPAEGASFMPGVSFFLQGAAYDLEDGTLPDPAYRWTSNRDGDLGTGATNLVILSPGPHVITLTVTDSDGNTAVKTIRLSAGDRVFLPLIWRAR